MGGWNIMISKFSTKKEAAIDFIKFMISDESQEIFYKEGGYYPVVNSFYQKAEYLKKYPEIEKIKELGTVCNSTSCSRRLHTLFKNYGLLY